MGRLSNKVAVVTGAASGFGKGIAQKFTEEGAKGIICDLSEVAAKAAAEELSCDVAVADVARREDWERVLQQVLDRYGQLDIVVNNAGVTHPNKPTVDVTDEDFDLVMRVNVKSIYLSANVIVPYFLREERPGCFIQISSTAALRPRPGLTWYNASKAAVSNATKTMAVEYAPKAIRFNAVCPVVGITGM
jgi:NAD(P)-dependent dehydrogenase (short-subunit alcohol dehydrogenase family)